MISVGPFQHYIPAGTPFDEAERILRAAGMATSRVPLSMEASFNGYTQQPAGYMRFHAELHRQQGDNDTAPVVGKIDAWLAKQIDAPSPPVKFPLDVSKASTIHATIKVEEERYYHFDLAFRGTRVDQMAGIADLAGDYVEKGDTRSKRNTGIAIPIHVVVTTAAQYVTYDKTVETRGSYKSGRLSIYRSVGALLLVPSVYHLRVSTMEDIPQLAGIAVEFSVSYDARL